MLSRRDYKTATDCAPNFSRYSNARSDQRTASSPRSIPPSKQRPFIGTTRRAMLLVRSIGCFVLVVAIVAASASAQQPGVSAMQPRRSPDAVQEPPKTLKERLGDKASDDQRVDNCKVPADRRGPKPRPDACAH
jgi:hypothetical protein